MSVYRVTDSDYTSQAVEAKKVLVTMELEVDPLNFNDDEELNSEIKGIQEFAGDIGSITKFEYNIN